VSKPRHQHNDAPTQAVSIKRYWSTMLSAISAPKHPTFEIAAYLNPRATSYCVGRSRSQFALHRLASLVHCQKRSSQSNTVYPRLTMDKARWSKKRKQHGSQCQDNIWASTNSANFGQPFFPPKNITNSLPIRPYTKHDQTNKRKMGNRSPIQEWMRESKEATNVLVRNLLLVNGIVTNKANVA